MSSTNRRDKQRSENTVKEQSSKVSSPSSPNSRKDHGKESSGSPSPRSLRNSEISQAHAMNDGVSGDDGRQRKNASLSTSSRAIGKRTSHIEDINIPLAQKFVGDHEGSSGSASAGSRSTGKNPGSGNSTSEPWSTRPTTPTISTRGSQVNSPSRVPVSASTSSTPESVTTAMSRLSSDDRMALSSNATEKSPIICSANKLESSSIANLNVYSIQFFPITPTREQCRAFIQKLHEKSNFRCLNKGYASDYASKLLTIGDIQDAAKKPLILPMPCSGKDHDGTDKQPNCHLLILRTNSIPIERVLDCVLTRPIVSLTGPQMETNLQALSMLIPRRYQDSVYNYHSKNRSKFYLSLEPSRTLKKQGLELTRGYVMDVSTSKGQLNLQAGSCTAVFYPEMVLSQLIETFGITNYSTESNKILESLLVGLKVRITYDDARKNKVKIIKSIGRPPRDIDFVDKEGNGSTNVIAHFEHRWGRKIEKPRLPAVNLGSSKDAKPSDDNSRASIPRNAKGNGKTNKITAVYVPPELCIVMPNQLRRGELSDEQKQIIATLARDSPKVDINHTVHNGLNRLGSPSKLPESRAFDLQNRQNQIAVSKRIWQSPRLIYENINGNSARSPNMKETSRNAINSALVTRNSVRNWSILRFNGGEPVMKDIESKAIKLFQQALKDRGWNMEPTAPKIFTVANSSSGAIETALRQAKDSAVEMLLVVLPDRNTTKHENIVGSSGRTSSNRSAKDLSQRGDHPNVGLDPVGYSTLKRIADTELGIHTVCLKVANLAKYVDALEEKKIQRNCANIAPKFNLKCGRTNQTIATRDNTLKESNTMVVGIHITPQMDPSPKKTNKPSKKNKRRANQGKSPTKPPPPPKCMENAPRIVSMVANSNHTLGQWPGSLRSQASDIDKPQKLGAMITERLEKWQLENNGSLPKDILVYRSGASEGQYESIIREDFSSIENGCAQIYSKQGPVRPKISMVIVTKLHDSGFAAIEGDSKQGTFVARDLAEAEQDFALQASIPILQNAEQRKSKTQEPKAGTTPNTERPEKAAPTHTRPARYVVVRDDMKAGIHALETITHQLCYVVGTTTRAVSLCAPIHYARLLCEHAKSYDYETYNQAWAPDGSNRAVFKGDPGMLSKIYHGMELKDSMFYV